MDPWITQNHNLHPSLVPFAVSYCISLYYLTAHLDFTRGGGSHTETTVTDTDLTLTVASKLTELTVTLIIYTKLLFCLSAWYCKMRRSSTDQMRMSRRRRWDNWSVNQYLHPIWSMLAAKRGGGEVVTCRGGVAQKQTWEQEQERSTEKDKEDEQLSGVQSLVTMTPGINVITSVNHIGD